MLGAVFNSQTLDGQTIMCCKRERSNKGERHFSSLELGNFEFIRERERRDHLRYLYHSTFGFRCIKLNHSEAVFRFLDCQIIVMINGIFVLTFLGKKYTAD